MTAGLQSALPARVFEDNGTPLLATFNFQPRDDKLSVVFYARGGKRGDPKSSNTDYERGLQILIARLGAGGARLDEAHLDTNREQRVLDVPATDLRGCDAYSVRRQLQSAQRSNGIRKMRLFISGLNVPNKHVEEYLSRGIVGTVEALDEKEGPEPVVISRTEGGKRVRLSKSAERDLGLRAAAIKIHGTRCKACGLSFGETYSGWGEGFIEVHHAFPLSAGERQTDPENDLVPLCSNCHRMVHWKHGITLTIEELQAKLQVETSVPRHTA
ncbi:HNH endonuclease [Pyxidicoccus xibeiensis]|uniref:HNH endonuclease n=1 Tax=Pyxidicoccus xibeiensis TaxID=2906759 RepID=UPI0020A6DF01|nr:HNH endonuclease [Pyxidicoccus xibeiensis]MCP3142318.1 HNH endonuclease [Pyxidicoccus xibeiensis]